MKKLLLILFCLPTFIYSQTNIGGVISANQTWTIAGSPYTAINNILVSDSVTLTINPGVEVRFDAGKVLQIDGELIAQGTDSNKITFTSNESNPASGDWGGIVFEDVSIDAIVDSINLEYISGSIIKSCIVEYAGPGITINHSHPFVEGNIIQFNK